MQKDVNETALPILTAMAMSGQALDTLLGGFLPQGHYAGGMNLYEYNASNPVNYRDPLGLIYDPFEDVDEWESDRIGHAIATLGVLADGAGLGLSVAVEILSSFIPGAGIYDAYKSGLALTDGEAGFWDYVAVGAVLAPVAGKVIGRAVAWGKDIYAAGKVEQRASSVSLKVLNNAACFVAGTWILMEDGAFVPIEWLRPSDDPFSVRDPFITDEATLNIVPEDWRIVHLEMDDVNCKTATISLLRPVEWLEMEVHSMTGSAASSVHGIDRRAGDRSSSDWPLTLIGETIPFSMPEMGLEGEARIVAIDSCPANVAGSATGIITGTFKREAPATIDLFIDALDKPIGTTVEHPFWSIDRGDWVAAGDLKPGEKLRTQDGSATVKSIIPRPGTETVYNIEVHKDHTFYVSEAQLLVHNECVTPGGRRFTKHGLEQARDRNIPSLVIDDTIDHYPGVPGREPGTIEHYSTANNVLVVLGDGGIVTVRKGRP